MAKLCRKEAMLTSMPANVMQNKECCEPNSEPLSLPNHSRPS